MKVSWRNNNSQPMLFRSFKEKDVSHKIKGLRSLSKDQLSSLKSDGLSTLKRESIAIVICKSDEDSLLCSNKNFCFLVISFHNTKFPLKNQGHVRDGHIGNTTTTTAIPNFLALLSNKIRGGKM